MNERSENGGVIVALGVALILLLLLVAGGGLVYVFLARQTAAVMMERQAARAAEAAEARKNFEQARALEALATARALAPQSQSTVSEGSSAGAAIEAVLRAQADAWNAGDIDKFMEHYWKSDDLTFSSGGQTTRGWAATLNRYREKYPTPDKMGRLTFDKLEITPLGETAALVLGEWHVAREPEPLIGNFSLVVRKIDDRWLIIHDHTSRLEGD